MSSKAYNMLLNENRTILEKLVASEEMSEPLFLEKNREQIYNFVSTLYMKYVRCGRQLEQCYDQALHPQKRRTLRTLLDSVLGRVLELKHELVAIEGLEYHPITDLLLEARILPSDVELPVPRYFLRNRDDEQKVRDQVLEQVFERHQAFKSEPHGGVGSSGFMTVEEAVRLIQIHERARQGRARAALMRSVKAKEDSLKAASHAGKVTKMEPYRAAVIIQKMWRGLNTRRKTKELRTQELVVLGMMPPPPMDGEVSPRELVSQLETQRHQLQEGYETDYQKALVNIRAKIEEEEGPIIMETLQDEIQLWYTQEWEEFGKIPDFPNEDNGGSVAIFNPPPIEENLTETKDVKISRKGGKDKIASRRSRLKTKPKEKKKEVEPPFSLKLSNFVSDIQNNLRIYSDTWGDKPEEDPNNIFETEIIETSLRPEVESTIRLQVDDMMRQEIDILKMAMEKDKGKRSKKAKLTKKMKKGGKKGKGRKKDKDLTPDRTLESLVEELVQQEILKCAPRVTLAEVLGDYTYFRSPRDVGLLPEPSLAEVKIAVLEFCILPLGSPSVHLKSPLVRSVLFAGPKGTGKKTLVNCICTETGSALFDLSASNIAGKYPGKAGLSMLMHLVHKVSKRIQPSVIFFEEAEKTFLKKIPRADKTDPKRLKKDLPKLVKGIGAEDRILICGVTHAPFDCDVKALTSCYQKILYIPKPNYSSRRVIWRELIQKNQGIITAALDFSTLTKISEGYTTGTIYTVVQQILNERRIAQMKKFPLTLSDFTNPLAQYDPIYRKEEEAYRIWFGKTPLGKKRLRLLKKTKKSEVQDDEDQEEISKTKKKKSGDRKAKKKEAKS